MTSSVVDQSAPAAHPGTPDQGKGVLVPGGFNGQVMVLRGSRLLSGVTDPRGLAAHRSRWGRHQSMTADQLGSLTQNAHVVGRGGAGFPFARKLATTARTKNSRKSIVVVNAAEGEPGSAKDAALLLTSPHLVLDGAALTARALGSTEVHLVVPHERPAVVAAARQAVAESDHDDLTFTVTATTGGFVSGQVMSVLELLAGRENLPVTSWEPPAISGLRGRPTLLSNAETFAQVAVLAAIGPQKYGAVGTSAEPGTVLLTVAGDGPHGVVVEVPHGVPLREVLAYCGYSVDAPIVIGGYHGVWLTPGDVAMRTLSKTDLAPVGASIGAGVILPVPKHDCPVVLTSFVVGYLAGQSARRCGPCRNGLPDLATVCAALAAGHAGDTVFDRLETLIGVLPGRGACAHPDGTVRLVRSMLRAFPMEVAAHIDGDCEYGLEGVSFAPTPLEPAPNGGPQ